MFFHKIDFFKINFQVRTYNLIFDLRMKNQNKIVKLYKKHYKIKHMMHVATCKIPFNKTISPSK